MLRTAVSTHYFSNSSFDCIFQGNRQLSRFKRRHRKTDFSNNLQKIYPRTRGKFTALKAKSSDDSVIYVGTCHKAVSVVDLTNSDTDLCQSSTKKNRKSKKNLAEKRTTKQNNIVLTQPINHEEHALVVYEASPSCLRNCVAIVDYSPETNNPTISILQSQCEYFPEGSSPEEVKF